MSQQLIRMTKGFRKANIKAGQMTEADADGEWQRPEIAESSPEAEEEFLAILQRMSRPISPDQAV